MMTGEKIPGDEPPEDGGPMLNVFVDETGQPYPAEDQLALSRIWLGIEYEISKDLNQS